MTKLDRSENWKKGENMSLSGIVSIGNIGINAVYVYLGMMLLCTAAVYYIVKKIYKWAIKKTNVAVYVLHWCEHHYN